MIKNYTPNDLISYIYHETSAIESIEIKNALENNDALMNEYDSLYESYVQLPKAQFRPSPKAIQNILLYSQNAEIMA